MRPRVLPVIVLCPLLLVLPSRAAAQDAAAAKLPDKARFHLFLLTGQSNMAGRGRVEQEDRTPHPRVLMFDKSGTWRPAVAPLHFDKPSVVGVGIGRSFALELIERDKSITIGLIPCAVGGSPIETWTPKGYHQQTKSHPWDDMLVRAKAAMREGTLKGILWHQGESDSQPGKAEKYEQRLQSLIGRMRSELGAPEAPFIAGQMGQFADNPWSDAKKQVDLVHRQLPNRVQHTAFVSSDGLKHKGDKVHFSAKSYRTLGRRYAAAYLKLQSAP